ncbi:MAG: TonB-dependent receptor [Candidatus Hatepunaea meridiana]|nr:TonB-dependent receptor [Candidatus Hatepunaea meridiana]
MKKTILLTISLLIILTLSPVTLIASAGETANLIGRVQDAETGLSLDAVNIIIEGTNRGASTSDEGSFLMFDLPSGQYNVIASMVGYETIVKKIEIVSGQTNKADFKLNPSPLELSGVVVTGTRTPRYIKDVPIRTEVITKKAIEDRSADNLYEALECTPGIRVEQQCQFCNFSVLRMQGLGADHTQVLLDGQPIYSGLAAVYGLQQMSTAEIDQIEVVKGAGSALYGSNAIAGAINIISTKPRTTEAKINIEMGEYGTNKYDVSAQSRKDNLGIFIFAQQNKADAIDQTSDGINSDQVKNPDGIADRVQTLSNTAGFNLFVDNLFKSDQLSLRGRILNEHRQGGELSDNLYDNPFSAGTERIVTDRYTIEAGYSRNFARGSELNLNYSMTYHKRNATNDTFLGDYEDTHNGESPPVDIFRPYIAEENLHVFTFNYLYPLSVSHRLLFGMQYTSNKLDESGKYVIVDEDDPNYGTAYTSYAEKEADDFGAYVQDEFTVTDALEIVGGLRFDSHKSEDGFRGSGDVCAGGVEPVKYDETSVNPRFAVKYSVTDKFTLRGSFGTGFRVPYGFSEDLHLCSGSPRVWKGTDLKPEKSASISATADYTTPVLGISLNLYRTALKDAISFADAGVQALAAGYTYEWKNIDDAFVMGAEISAQYAVTRDIALSANIALNKGEYDHVREDWVGSQYEEDSKYISRYPLAAGGLKIAYSPGAWNFVFDTDYKGKMYIDYMKEEDPAAPESKIKQTESFLLFNAQASRIFGQRFKLYIGVHNLTDYVQEEKHTDDAAFMYAPVYGRIVYGGTRITLR